MKIKKVILLFLLGFTTYFYSQNDCVDALVVCGNDSYKNLTATGIGVQELDESSSACGLQETNSLWFQVYIKTGGTLGFTLTPTNADDTHNTDIEVDFDFFIFGPNASCSNLGKAIRCSTTNPEDSGQSDNLTGMNSSETDISEGPGADGNSFVKWLDVNANESYFIVIDRPIGNSNFKIDWTGTATFPKPPTIGPPPTGTTYDLLGCGITDAFDGDVTFDITPNENSIVNGQANIAVSYYTSYNDALTNNNAIRNPINYTTTSATQTIFVKLTNELTECFVITSFNLTVYLEPTVTSPVTLTLCDDNADGVATFNLTDANTLISTNSTNETFTFFETLAEAQANTGAITISTAYNNQIANNNTVFSRITNTNNCFTTAQINLVVNPLPIINTAVELKQCDNDTDGFSDFNLYEAASDISSDYQNETFIFYPTLADANADTSPYSALEATAFQNRNQNSDTVWARAKNSFDCYRISEVLLTVSTTGIPGNFQRSFTACDDFLDENGNNTINNSDIDGVSSFDFSAVNAEVIALFPVGQQLTVTYYRNEADALAEINPIINTSNYRNISSPNTQNIFIRVDSNLDNDCLGLGSHITLNIDTVPIENPVQNIEDCDNIDDGSATNGIIQTFNLESQTTTILGTQNPLNYTVTYHDSAANANSGNTPLTSPYTNTVRDSQTIYVRVTNNTTSCFTDHSTFNLILNPLPIANFVTDLEVCDDNSDGSARNGFSQTIDLESQTATILDTQDPSIYTVTYHRSLADAQNGSSPLVSPYTNLIPNRETIHIRIYNTSTMCRNGISNFDVIVNPEPTFETISNLSECDNNDDSNDANGFIQTIDLDGKIPEIIGTSQDPDDFIVTFHSTKANATNGTAALTSPYTNTTDTEYIFVRIQNKATLCVNDDATFQVIINSLPDFTVKTPQILCLNNPPLKIYAENPMNVYNYVWTNANGGIISTTDNTNITVGGTYKVTVTTTNGTMCTKEENIVVNESNPATLDISFITIIDESNNISSQNNLSILINTIDNDLDPRNYQFAILNTDDNTRTPFAGFQDEPLFENLEGGIYQIIVNDKNDCYLDTTLLVSVIQFPKFFTPNSDGENDTWMIRGANKTFYPNGSINIFNRYGKLLAQLEIDGEGWDGTYNGKRLSSNDYWFNITLIPADTANPTINKTGNFSLLRK